MKEQKQYHHERGGIALSESGHQLESTHKLSIDKPPRRIQKPLIANNERLDIIHEGDQNNSPISRAKRARNPNNNDNYHYRQPSNLREKA